MTSAAPGVRVSASSATSVFSIAGRSTWRAARNDRAMKLLITEQSLYSHRAPPIESRHVFSGHDVFALPLPRGELARAAGNEGRRVALLRRGSRGGRRRAPPSRGARP